MSSPKIQIGEDSFDKLTICTFANVIYTFCKTNHPELGSLRANLVRLIGTFKEIDLEVKRELAILLNISQQNFDKHLKEKFVDYNNPKSEQCERSKTIEDREDVEDWILNNTFSHYKQQQKISFDCMTHAFKKYRDSGRRSPFNTFSEVWKSLHVHVSCHDRYDFYGCAKCHNRRLHAYEFIYTNFKKNDVIFPFHRPEVVHLLKGQIGVEKYQNYLRFRKFIPFLWYYYTKNICLAPLPVCLFNYIISNIISPIEAFDILNRIYIPLKQHHLVKSYEDKMFYSDILLSNSDSSHLTAVLDYCYHQLNEKHTASDNIKELMIVVYRESKFFYHKFIVPTSYKLSKGNFVFFAVQKIFKLYDKIKHFHFWSDNCTGDFKQNVFLYLLSTMANEKRGITWNFREAYHCKSLADAMFGTENNLIRSRLKDFHYYESYDRNFALSVIGSTKNTSFYEPLLKEIPDYMSETNISDVKGLSFHHSFIFIKKGEFIMRKFTGIQGCYERSRKENKCKKKEGDYYFDFSPQHIIERVKRPQSQKEKKNNEKNKKNKKNIN